MNKPRLDQGPDYERGFVDGMQHQMQSSVDKAVNRMAQQEPVAGWLEPIGILMKLEGDKHMKLYAMDEQLEQQLVATDKEWDGVLHKGIFIEAAHGIKEKNQ